jgi:hypothetical protein
MTKREQRALPVDLDPKGPQNDAYLLGKDQSIVNGRPILPSVQHRLLVPVGSYMRKTLAIGL